MKSFKKYISIIFFFSLAGLLLIAGKYVQDNLSSEDSGALYGGKLETGYKSGGYLVSENFAGEYNYCGMSNVASDTVITAAHCVDDTQNVEIGFDDFTFEGDYDISVNRVFRNAGWDDQDVNKDFAVIKYTNNGDDFIPQAFVQEPQVGCSYRVVGYGQTEDEITTALQSRPRKSASICITSVDERTFRLKGNDGGICLGDSGSPIYKEGSNVVVGVISSIIKKDEGNPCFIQNEAIAVRADVSYNEFLSLVNSQQIDTSFNSEEIVQTTTLTTQFKSLTDDFSVQNEVDKLLNGENQTIFIFAGIFFAFLASMMLLVNLLRKAE